MAAYVIYVRDSNNDRVAEIDRFVKLDMVLRFNAVGTWALAVDYDTATDKGLTKGAGIAVVRDGTTLLSGPMTRLTRNWNRDGDVLTASGVTDTVWLQRRWASPVPSGPPYTSQAYDVRTGAAETVLKGYVNVNAGPGATSNRQVPGLTIDTDVGEGDTVTGRARFDSLLELLQGLAVAGGDLGFRIVQVGNGLEFQTYQPTDKTATVLFSSEIGNLLEFEYAQESAAANYIIVAGGGEGTARTFEEGGDSSSITTWGRIEAFRDRRDTTDSNELLQTLNTELDERAEKTSLSIRPIDTEAVQFMTDWQLGDRVTVVAGDTIQAVIREAKITLDRSGEVVVPVVGPPGTKEPGTPRIFEDAKRNEGRIRNLERR